MKVTTESKMANSVGKLHPGECFMYWYDLFIVTDEFDSGCRRRCVKLKDGTVFYFGKELVTPVDAEVIIHD